MTTGTPNRACGRCGAPVDPITDTCPRCGALLAAYEAPQGSSPVHDVTAGAPAMPVDRVTPQPRRTSQPNPPVTTTPETTPLPPALPPQAPLTTTREPEPAATEARTELVSVLNDRQEVMEAGATASHTNLVSVLNARESAMQPPVASRPRSTGQRTRPAPPREVSMRQRPSPATPMSTRQITSMAASFGKLTLGVLMILVFLGILDFNLIPILVLGVVLLSLLGIMRSAAKASGRKTTSMHDPKRRDTSRR